MTLEEIRTAEAAALETRRQELGNVSEDMSADEIRAYNDELRTINAELEARRQAAAESRQLAEEVAKRGGIQMAAAPQENTAPKTNEEIRSSAAYVNAYAKYIKTEDPTECRALLTENVATGTVPVPTVVEGYIRAAWERTSFMRLVRRVYVRGNYRVGFEISSTGATVHTEGTNAPQEEQLVIGSVNLVPASIKKWIRISDEAYDMGGEEFLRYIYDELTNKIAQAAADLLLDKIIASPAASSAEDGPGVPVVSVSALALDTIAQALAQLGDHATAPVIVMNRATHAAFRALQLSAQYGVDPYEGLDVYYSSHLPAFASATAGQTAVIVGDFGEGALANFPNGDEIKIKFDDLSESEKDLVKIVGREYVALEVVSPNAFVKVNKQA